MAPAAIAVGTLCVVKFNDIDGDGQQGTNEPTLTGWVFTVKDANANTVGTMGTAPGLSRCIDLPPGTYTVTETLQAGWLATTAGGATQTVTVVAGQTINVIFGNRQTGRLCIVKFNDLNGNGLQEANEPLLANWTFNISQPSHQWFAPGIGIVIAIGITTGPNGQICQDLFAGTYQIDEVLQSGWVQTAPVPIGPQTVTITAGQTTTVAFGNHQNPEPGKLCVVKFNDLNGDGKQDPNEPLLAGWVFTIKDANGNVVGTITTVLGATNCVNLPPGTYTVTETPQAGWTPTTLGGLTQTAVVVSGQTTTVTFGNHQTDLGRLCVVKFNDLNGNGKQDPGEPLLAGWKFTIKDANGNVVGTITTVLGAANCITLPPGTYTVTETLQAGWTPTTPGGLTQTATVVAGQTTNVTFGNKRCCLTFTFLGGKIDNFSLANGATAEPVTPVIPALTLPTANYFDATASNVRFGHRFYMGTGNCIESATLQIKMKALQLGSSGSNNDTLRIQAGSTVWSKYIGNIPPLLLPPLAPATSGGWTPAANPTPDVKTVVLNLGAMVPASPSTLISALNSSRILDITIQDDTSVDYIRLIVVFCECKTHLPT